MRPMCVPMRMSPWKRWPALVAIALASLAWSCVSSAPVPPTADQIREQMRKEVEAAMQRYTELLRTGPPEAIADSYTVDGLMLQPGMKPLRGSLEIQEFLSPLFAAFEVLEATTETEAIEIHGTAAYQWGKYSQRAGPRGKAAEEFSGRYVAEWRREADGKWRIVRFLVQPSPRPREG